MVNIFRFRYCFLKNKKEYGITQKGLDVIDRIIKESPQYKKLIEEFLEDYDFIWFIMETEGTFDEVSPEVYKKLHNARKKWEERK